MLPIKYPAFDMSTLYSVLVVSRKNQSTRMSSKKVIHEVYEHFFIPRRHVHIYVALDF